MRITLGFLLLLAGCSHSPKSTSVKLVKLTTWPLSDEVATLVDSDQRAYLAQRGITMQGSTIVFPELPLVGYWVEIGGTRYITDENAVVTLHADDDAVGTVFEDFTSTTELATFKIHDVKLLPVPARVEITQVLPAPGDMNPDVLKNMRLPGSGLDEQSLPYPDGNCAVRNTDHCAPKDNTMGCCVDYDNPSGNGVAYDRTGALECSAFSVANFVSSTCFNWTLVSVCADEAAFGRGPNCWHHHKYRNCQNLSLFDFQVTSPGSTLVLPGETVKLKIRNNLPSNDTIIGLTSTVDDHGTISSPTNGAGLGKSGELYVVEHYDDAAQKHVEDTEVTYTAPPRSALPTLCTTVDVSVEVFARTFDPVADIAGTSVPKFPIFKHETIVITIDCDTSKPPDLHLRWQLSDNPPKPNIDLASFNVTAEIDLVSTKHDDESAQYGVSGGTVTFTNNPVDPDPKDPCTHSASIATFQLPAPQPAQFTISAKSPGTLFGAGAVTVTVVQQDECPDPAQGGKTIVNVHTYDSDFVYMQIYSVVPIGSLEDLEKGPVHGILGAAPGPTGDWTLTKR